MIYLTRRYSFCASHRLHSQALTAEENARTYGKCNNPHGHGHNYFLEVCVAGPVDSSTGMVCDLAVLDDMVHREILERLDHANLNQDVENFRSLVPTSENLCIVILNLLLAQLKSLDSFRSVRLVRVRLDETHANYFEYEGDGAASDRKVR